MPARKGASGREWGPGRIAEDISSASIAEPAERRKQPNFGACIGCGIRIAPSSTTLHCATCSAWRRWFSAHRIASQALREAT